MKAFPCGHNPSGWADARFIGGNMNLPNGKGDELHLNTLMMIMQRDRCGN